MGGTNWIDSQSATHAVPCKNCYPPASHWSDGENNQLKQRSLVTRSYASDSRQAWQPNSVSRYFKTFHWIPLSLGFGIAYIAYLRYRYVRGREQLKITTANVTDFLASEFEVNLYKMLPLNSTSRIVGKVNNMTVPRWARPHVYGAYAKTYGCKIDEAEVEDLTQYQTLGEFFRRSLKPGLRPIHAGNCVVSPADGTVLHFGKVDNGLVEQVKGITYSLSSFLGPKTWGNDEMGLDSNSELTHGDYQRSLLKGKDTELYHAVVYLAPGDYHRFHSPTDWQVHYRRHFPGHLLSVRPGLVSWIAGLFNINERVAYMGEWKHGFFSMIAVGATSVGSIKIYCDENLVTNCKKSKKGSYCDQAVSTNNNVVEFQKGDPFGEFNFGSTIVLVFEAPKDFHFNIEPGQKVQYGQLLSACKKHVQERSS